MLFPIGIFKLKLVKSRVWKLFLPDGFEVDEDEILNSSLTENTVLIIAESFTDVVQTKQGKLTGI